MNLLRARIDLDAIAYNVATIKDRVGPDVRLMCVVKANAYNHGLDRVAEVMARAGADAFGVATIAEAVRLRQAGANLPILAWIWNPHEDITDALAAGIEIAAPSLAHARAVVNAGVPARVCVKVETGMHRSGVDEADWDETFALLSDAKHIDVTGLMTHFACADDPDNPANDAQLEAFARALDKAHAAGLECPVNHVANSPALLSRTDTHFQQVRAGLACYGCEPIAGEDNGLRPAMTWAGDVINVKPIAAGESTSYGQTWTAERDSYLAVIPCGYADGLPRAVQGKLEVGIGGKRYPQVGRVCMDQIVVDLGDNPFGVAAGDEAVIFGQGGMSATELAGAIGTINYEILCRPQGRTVHVYEGGIDLAQ